MRESIKEFVKIVSRCFPINEPIYEFGSYQVPGQEGFADIRPLFPQKEFFGCDMRMGPGVDLVLDLHDINIPSGSVGTVIILETLEHVEYPRKALQEAYRILKPDGRLLITSEMKFPIHDAPNDYWRFTPQGFESLLKPFQDKFVGFAGDKEFPHTIIGIGSKTSFQNNDIKEFEREYFIWQKKWNYFGKSIIRNAIQRPHAILPYIRKKIK